MERFSRLVGNLYDAPLDHGALPAALCDLADLTGVEKAAVIKSFPDGVQSISAAVGMEQGSIDAYNAHYHRLDILIPTLGAPPTAFTRTTANAYWPDFARSEFFNEWARPNENYQVAFVTVPLAGGIRSSLVLVASAKDRGFGSAGQIMLLQLLAPHFQRMMTMAARLSDLEHQRDQFLSELGRSPYGLVVLDRQARVRHATGPAIEILRAGDGLRLTSRGIRARNPEADRKLGALIARALACYENGQACALDPVSIPRASLAHPFLVQAFPLGGLSQHPGDPWTCASLDDGAVMVVVADLSHTAPPSAELVRLAFGLTQAEAAVALLVLDGHGLKAVADDLGVSISTVRTHLLSIFNKTDTHRQAELVRLLAKLVPSTGFTSGAKTN